MSYSIEQIYNLSNSDGGLSLPFYTQKMMQKKIIRRNGGKRVNSEFMNKTNRNTATEFNLRKKNKGDIKKKIKGLMNKLNNSNCEAIGEKIQSYMSNEEMAKFIIDLLFDNAIFNKIFIKLYAKLFKSLGAKKTFKSYLEDVLNNKLKLLEKSIQDEVDGKNVDNYRDFLNFIQNKNNYCNIYSFLTNLYLNKIITFKMLGSYGNSLVNEMKNCTNKDDNDLYGMALKELLMECNNKKMYNRYKKSIHIFKSDKENFKTRIRFGMLDLIEKYE